LCFIPFIGAYYILRMKKFYSGYQNNNQCVSIIQKVGSGITYYLILDPGIENSIQGLQSLVVISVVLSSASDDHNLMLWLIRAVQHICICISAEINDKLIV